MGGHNGCSVAELSLAEVSPVVQISCASACLEISFRGIIFSGISVSTEIRMLDFLILPSPRWASHPMPTRKVCGESSPRRFGHDHPMWLAH